jgi:hypothetical protein
MLKNLFFNKTVVLLMALLFVSALRTEAKDCPACGAENMPDLIMLCPECGANMHDYAYEKKGTDRSALIIRLYYTGNNPNKLADYAKLYINGKYKGNIELTEKQSRKEDINGWNNGLGDTFTALYEKEFREIPIGQLKVEVEMKFTRMYGLARSYKRAVFPYVNFTGKEKTVIEHYFESAVDFSVTDKKKKETIKEESKKEIPVVSDTKLKTGTGTVKLDIGLFD